MGLIVLVCFVVGIISFGSLVGLIYKKVKCKIDNKEFKWDLNFPFDSYKEKPLLFLIVGLIIILMTVFTISSALLAIIFPDNLKYKPEGTYCYYVIDDNNNAYPAKIEKTIDTEDTGEDYFGNPTSDTYISVDLLELYIDNDIYDFTDDPEEISTDKFTSISYYNESESVDSEGYEVEEKEFNIKLTNDVAYCPSFGKGKTKTDYFELIIEIIVLVSEIAMFIITIYANRKE